MPELESELRRRLPSDTAFDAIHVALTPEAPGYHLVVEVGDQRRELRDPSCRELLRAAVVITVALVLPEERAAATAPPSAPPDARPAPPSNVATKGAPHSAPRLALAAGVGVHLGTTPTATLLLELDGQLVWSRYGVAAGLRYLAPSSARDNRGHGVNVSGFGADVAGSFSPWPRVQGRAGLVLYRLSGAGRGSLHNQDDSAWNAGPILSARYTPYARAPFWTSIGAEGQLNLLRAHFEVSNYAEVFHVPWFSGSAFVQAGIGW